MMSSASTDIRDKFRIFLNEQGVNDTSRWLNVVDFGLKVLLQSVGELKKNQEVYDVTDLQRVDDWRNKMRSEQAWQYIDRQNNGLLSKALTYYYRFVESLDLTDNSTKGLKPAKPIETIDDMQEVKPGIKVSNSRDIIFIDPNVTEGAAKDITLTRYERNPLARQLCIDAYGGTYRCEVCGFKLSDKYGSRQGKDDYIEVHHLEEHAAKSKTEGEHPVNYRKDMIPLCPNCHRMIHYLKDHTIHPDELREIIHTHERKE